MKIRPDKKFVSIDALTHCYRNIKEPIIISLDCYQKGKNNLLKNLTYEIFVPAEKPVEEDPIYSEVSTAIECNNGLYVDEVIFVGMPWELEKAKKYFGDQMMVNGFDI